ncbi:MAG: hypothetical protein LBQ46_10070 [Treponema sp.]|jgi:hypothetical protein|nr:hypothetical protein [Treponema sp.]
MKRLTKHALFPALAVLLLTAMLFPACGGNSPGGGARSPEEILAATAPGYQDYTAAEWEAWAEDTGSKLPDAEQEAIVLYMKAHLDDLTADGKLFWQQMIGTDVVPEETSGPDKIGGVAYDSKAASDEGGTHYNLTINANANTTYDAALAAFTTLFGFEPYSGGYLTRGGSTLSAAAGEWVIFEITVYGDYRLVKKDGGNITGVHWNNENSTE